MYLPVQAAVDEAIADALPIYLPGATTQTAADEFAAFEWPFPDAGPTAAIHCRLLPVPSGASFWETQARLADAVARAGASILWGERLPRAGRRGNRHSPDETSDLLRLDLGVPHRPTHTLLLYKPAAEAPQIRWSAGQTASSWTALQESTAPVVALVFDDWGYFESETTRGLLALDVPLTLAILPGLPFSRRYALEATELAVPAAPAGAATAGSERLAAARRADLSGQRRSRGLPVEFALARSVTRLPSRRREIILHLPMEPEDPRLDPGPGAIRVGMSAAEVAVAVEAALAGLPHVTGVNNHMGSRATADEATMARVMAVLAAKDLYFLDSLTTPRSVAAQAATRAGVAALRNRIFLDQAEPASDQIRRNLQQLIRSARSRGFAIGIGHPYAETLAVLRSELPRLQREGVRFVTLSEYLALQRRATAIHE
jgi:polysaccharide deacetylase 2 family uncharacterized protein YibQ